MAKKKKNAKKYPHYKVVRRYSRFGDLEYFIKSGSDVHGPFTRRDIASDYARDFNEEGRKQQKADRESSKSNPTRKGKTNRWIKGKAFKVVRKGGKTVVMVKK